MSYYRNNPCRYCDERTMDCHSGCEKYTAWKGEVDERNQMKKEVLSNEDNIIRYKKMSNDKMMRRQGRVKK